MLNVELLSAVVFDHDTWDQETGTIDPAIVARGELPARARPFVVDRVYRAPAGHYDESFAIIDQHGQVVYQHEYARIVLRGEMFEDRYRDTVRANPVFSSADEHTMVFLVSDQEVGRIPIFVDAPDSAKAAGVMNDVLSSTLKKSAIIWLTIPQPDGSTVTRPAWFVYQDGKVFVLTGPDEQDLTNIDRAEQVELTARSKDVRAAVGTVPAVVRVVDNDSDEFAQIAEAGLSTRLNLEDGHDALERWRSTCTMVELTPQD
ncbi:MAG: hypothetical protein KY437_07085 [Actinobacteria bacterium]|nr:hypothetical protein [Actinomycetota bacterium]